MKGRAVAAHTCGLCMGQTLEKGVLLALMRPALPALAALTREGREKRGGSALAIEQAEYPRIREFAYSRAPPRAPT